MFEVFFVFFQNIGNDLFVYMIAQVNTLYVCNSYVLPDVQYIQRWWWDSETVTWCTGHKNTVTCMLCQYYIYSYMHT